jgi:hypothetical protein
MWGKQSGESERLAMDRLPERQDGIGRRLGVNIRLNNIAGTDMYGQVTEGDRRQRTASLLVR